MRDRISSLGALAAALAAVGGLLACVEAQPQPRPTSGDCCIYTGPQVHDCAAIETLGAGADLDGRCNQVNQGSSCAWDYSDPECCEIAATDGAGERFSCEPGGTSGECCVYTGPVAADCAALEALGPGADLDGRCSQINQGMSCSWLYGQEGCCEKALADGFPAGIVCP